MAARIVGVCLFSMLLPVITRCDAFLADKSENGTLMGCAAGQKAFCASTPRFAYTWTIADLDAELTVRGDGWGEIGSKLSRDNDPPIRVGILGGSMTCGTNIAKNEAGRLCSRSTSSAPTRVVSSLSIAARAPQASRGPCTSFRSSSKSAMTF